MKRFLLALLATTSFAHAAYYVECGTVSDDESGLKQVVFKASSQDDIFRGENGREWEVALEGDWLPAGRARAQVMRSGNAKKLQVTISRGQGFSEIGKRYVVSGMYDEFPKLEVFNVGGFAGGVRVNEFACFTAID